LEHLEKLVRRAARALGRAGLAHAYGHCSARVDDKHFLVCAAKAMGTIRPGERGTVVAIEGALPEGVLGEVRLHQQIYKRRPEIGGVCRIMPPVLMGLSVLRITPQPRHGFGAFFAPAPPLWDDVRLVRDDERARAVAELMGAAKAIVMRANGAVTAGRTLEEAVVFAWYLEEAARIEHFVRQLPGNPDHALLTAEEIIARDVSSGRVYERMWDYLCDGDPE